MICDAQGVLIGAETPEQLSDKIHSMGLPPGEQIPVIDAVAEGWVLNIDHMVVSPLTRKKSWAKKEVIELFNRSKTAREAGLEYPERSLSSKRFDRILGEMVKLILNANKSLGPTRESRGPLSLCVVPEQMKKEDDLRFVRAVATHRQVEDVHRRSIQLKNQGKVDEILQWDKVRSATYNILFTHKATGLRWVVYLPDQAYPGEVRVLKDEEIE